MYKQDEYGAGNKKKKLVNVFEQNMLAEKAEQDRIEALRVKPKGQAKKLSVPVPEPEPVQEEQK